MCPKKSGEFVISWLRAAKLSRGGLRLIPDQILSWGRHIHVSSVNGFTRVLSNKVEVIFNDDGFHPTRLYLVEDIGVLNDIGILGPIEQE